MSALSMDLRTRIVEAYEAGEGSYESLATRFAVSRSVVGKLVRQHRVLGTLAPQMHRRGRKRSIAGKLLEKLKRHVDECPDATLSERIEHLGITCSINTMSLTLKRLGYSFKKVDTCC